MPAVPEEFHDLFEKRTIAHVATLMPDGTPHVTPVWVDYDPEANQVLFNTATGRRKERNLDPGSSVAVSMTDPDDPYRFVSVRGTVADIVERGAEDHIDELAARYMDLEEYPNDDEEGERVVVRIAISDVATS